MPGFEVLSFRPEIHDHPGCAENAVGFKLKPPGMTVSARIKVCEDVDNPRQWELGFFQIMTSFEGYLRSVNKGRRTYLSVCPCADSGTEDIIPFVRKGGFAYEKDLEAGLDYPIIYGDTPNFPSTTWTLDADPIVYGHLYLEFSDWLVARRPGPTLAEDEVIYLKHFRWSTKITALINTSALLGQRIRLIRPCEAAVSNLGDGRGPDNPAPAFRRPNGYRAQSTLNEVIFTITSGPLFDNVVPYLGATSVAT